MIAELAPPQRSSEVRFSQVAQKYSTVSQRMFTNTELEPDLFGMNTDLFTEPLVCDSSTDRCVQAIMAGVRSRLKQTSLIYNSNLRVGLLRNSVTGEKQSRGIFCW